MTGLLDFLPFLDGWDYHVYTIPYHQIVQGNPVQKLKVEKRGWVMQGFLATTDAFGSLVYDVQGPGGTVSTLTVDPEFCLNIGNIQYDPWGYLMMYNRPLPASTNGFYVVSLMGPGYSGFPFPFVKEILIRTFLGVGSTQNAALLTAVALLIEIKDEKTWFKSLRSLGILPYTSALEALAGKAGKAEEQEDVSKTLRAILEELRNRR